ncbi:MAG: HD domain-containing protein [Desulfurococcaceae archaeon]
MEFIKESFTWKMISDPLYGYAYFNTEVEEPLINNVIVQRLRYIMQLQTAHFVYPGAVHTRFQHSIGVMHLAGQMARDTISKIITFYDKSALEGYSPETLIEASRLAGLLHDIGHAAFSHAFEHGVLWKKQLPLELSNHERIGLTLIKVALNDYIEKFDEMLPGLKKVLYSILEPGEHKGIIRVLKWVVNEGYYPADVIDFLRRDSYYAGTVEYGSILYERLYKNTYPLIDGNKVSFVLDRIAIGEFKQYMYAKANMYEHVYYHSVCRSFDRILFDILDGLDKELDFEGRTKSILKGDVKGYLELTDVFLYSIMLHKALHEDSKLALLCRRMLIDRKPEWKKVGRDVSISISKGLNGLEKTLRLILDSSYRTEVRNALKEYLLDKLRSRNIDDEDLWIDVLDITPLPKSTIYPGGELSTKTPTLLIGKKIGQKIVVSEEFNLLIEELPLKVIFRVYVPRGKYSAELETTITPALTGALNDILGIDVNASLKILENIYTGYSDRDYSKLKLTM